MTAYVAPLWYRFAPPHAGEYGNFSVAHGQIQDMRSMPGVGTAGQIGDTIDLAFIPASTKILGGYLINTNGTTGASTISLGWRFADLSASQNSTIASALSSLTGYAQPGAANLLAAAGIGTGAVGRTNMAFQPFIPTIPLTTLVSNSLLGFLPGNLQNSTDEDRDIIIYATIGGAAIANAGAAPALDLIVEYQHLGTK